MKFYINISLITLLFFVGLFEAAAQHVPAVTHQKKFPLTRAGFISTTASPSLTCDDGEVLGWKDGERICIPKDSFELAGIHFPDCNGEDFLIVSQLDGSYDCIHIDSLSFSTTAVLADSGPCDQYFSAPSNSLVIGDAVFLKGGVVTKGKNTTSGDSLANWIVVEKSADSVRLAQCGVWIFNHGGIDGMTFFQGVNFPTIDPSSLDWNKPLYRGVGTGEIEILVGQRAIGKSVQDINNNLLKEDEIAFGSEEDTITSSSLLRYIEIDDFGIGLIDRRLHMGASSTPLSSGITAILEDSTTSVGTGRMGMEIKYNDETPTLAGVETFRGSQNFAATTSKNGFRTEASLFSYPTSNTSLSKQNSVGIRFSSTSSLNSSPNELAGTETPRIVIGCNDKDNLNYLDFVRNIEKGGLTETDMNPLMRLQLKGTEAGQIKLFDYINSNFKFLDNNPDYIASFVEGKLRKTDFDSAIDIAISKRLHADDAAAITAGRTVGEFYYNTTDEKLTRVQ